LKRIGRDAGAGDECDVPCPISDELTAQTQVSGARGLYAPRDRHPLQHGSVCVSGLYRQCHHITQARRTLSREDLHARGNAAGVVENHEAYGHLRAGL